MGFILITEEMLGIDNNKPEFKTFIVADHTDSYYCEWDYIKANFAPYVKRIEDKIKELDGGDGYIGIHEPQDVGTSYFEIQWD